MSDRITHHYHLIVGEIVFRQKETKEINVIRVNGILADESKQIPVRLLNKSQQILQLNFLKNMSEEDIEIVDVIFIGITYLGEFTAEEFHKEPEGMKTQERVQEPAPAPEDNASNLRVMGQSRDQLEDAVADAGKPN